MKYLKRILLGIVLLVVVLFFSGWIGFEVWLDFQTKDMRKNVKASGKAVLRDLTYQRYWGDGLHNAEELYQQCQIIKSFSIEDRIDFYEFFILKCLDYSIVYLPDYFYDLLLREDMDAVKPLMNDLVSLKESDRFKTLTLSQQGKIDDGIRLCNWLITSP